MPAAEVFRLLQALRDGLRLAGERALGGRTGCARGQSGTLKEDGGDVCSVEAAGQVQLLGDLREQLLRRSTRCLLLKLRTFELRLQIILQLGERLHQRVDAAQYETRTVAGRCQAGRTVPVY